MEFEKDGCSCTAKVLLMSYGLSSIFGAQKGADKSPIDQYKHVFYEQVTAVKVCSLLFPS